MKKLIYTLVITLIAINCWAVKPQRGPHTVRQSDGTQLTIYSHGDAFSHWYTTADGVLLVHDDLSYYIAEVGDDGSLKATGILAHSPSNRNEQEKAAIKRQDKHLFLSAMQQETASAAKKSGMRKEKLANNSSYFPHEGTPKAIVILAEFSDSLFKNNYETTRKLFDSFLNADGQPTNDVDKTVERNYGSVKQYFKDMSFGKFAPQFDVYGPVKLNNKMSYYGSGSNDRMDLFIPDVCKAADDLIDFSQYDADNDGKVDLVYIIYAGYGESYSGVTSNAIWPKSSTGSYGSYDGKTVSRYGVHCELGGAPIHTEAWGEKRINGIGLFVHEFSHCMGLPDIYPTNDGARINNQAMEDWDVMDGGEYLGGNIGFYPAEYTPWEQEVMGWMTIDTLKEAQQVSLQTIQNGGKAYRIMNDNDSKGREYFLLFNVQKQGWNSYARGHGMLVMHLNYSSENVGVSDHPNNTAGQPRLTIVPADGLLISSYQVLGEDEVDPRKYTAAEYRASYAGDPFPGSLNVRFLTDTSEVKPTVYVGESLNKPIFNINESEDGIITFDFLENISSGLRGVMITGNDEKKRIYSLDGIYVGDDPTKLPKGIYIMNRRKVIVP
ncbi:MAG: M6 family metalloprotease domain-containing protein [Prevotella sp.]|nr:M6 family metalloprotease domain-containing protein [Prevotella sp.]